MGERAKWERERAKWERGLSGRERERRLSGRERAKWDTGGLRQIAPIPEEVVFFLFVTVHGFTLRVRGAPA